MESESCQPIVLQRSQGKGAGCGAAGEGRMNQGLRGLKVGVGPIDSCALGGQVGEERRMTEAPQALVP